MSRVEGHPISLRAKLLVLGALGVAGPVLVACGTRAGGPEVSGQGGNGGNTEPVATRTLTSETASTAVIPTETVFAPEPTATEEAALTPEELQNVVKKALDTIQNSIDKDTVIAELDDGIKSIPQAESDPGHYINPPLNAFGNTGLDLGELACANPANEDLANAWLALRSFATQFYMRFEIGTPSGVLPPENRQRYLETFFNVPLNCQNPAMVVQP